jgi:dTDP-4-dehydrorhamnose reductase
VKALVTGINGTVAPVLADALRAAGHEVVPWNRRTVPTDNPAAIRMFLRGERPDWFFHVATGSPDWAELTARECSLLGIRFLFTSSVSVFGSSQRGPFGVDTLPRPDDDYGRYKLECEQRVRAVNPESLVVRLGWQIGKAPGGNHMVDHLERIFQSQGRISASIHWYPACAFLEDTADSLRHIMETLPAGLYHLEGNPGLNFHDIVLGLNRLRGEPWVVISCGQPVQNNRLLDTRTTLRPISDRLRKT